MFDDKNKDFSPETLAYQEHCLAFILKEAKNLQRNFNSFIAKVQKITVTESNIQDMIFTHCAWSNQFRGILLQAKFCSEINTFMLLLRLIHVNTNQVEKVKWVPLKTKVEGSENY